ncbi:BF3164 family lipoprotein [Penaeicola halotolerans]|uniref:BF3164 family lipoprotein n=1 Tax=Penaeicola halotolerans TaxID=2793196 RepID=UPI001CF809A3|nr:BF3164 family lipoprotein [Penaeicola halotolerans]
MKKFLLFFSLLLVTLFGCEERYPIGAKFFTYDDIPQTITLKGERLDIPELQNPRKVHYQNGLLYIADDHGGFKIHVVALDDSLTYINRLGVDGVGPGEFTHVWKIEPAPEKDHIWALDIQTKKYHKFSAYQESPKALMDFRQRKDLVAGTELVWIANDRLAGWSEFGGGKFVLFDSAGNQLSAHGKFAGMIEGDWEEFTLNSFFQGHFNFNDNRQKVISTTASADILEIFDLKTKEIITVSGPLNQANDFSIIDVLGYPMAASNGGDMVYYYDGYPTDNYIFANYWGLTDKVIREENDYTSEILVFDYEGNPLCRMLLDRPIIHLSVDEANKTIYGVSFDKEPSIYAYKFDF